MMLLGMKEACRQLWRRLLFLQHSLSLHVSIPTLWTLGLISDTSLILDPNSMERRFDSAERSGRVTSHTPLLVLLGKCGAGKTSLSLTLRDQPLMPESAGPPKTLGLEETLVEVSYVDMSWREVGRRFLEMVNNSEFIRALLFFVAADVGKQRLIMKSGVSFGHVKTMIVQGVLFTCITTFVVWVRITLHFGLVLLICCALYSLVNCSHNLHFIVGEGCATAVTAINVALMQNYTSNVDISYTIKQLISTAFIIYFCMTFLGLGTGAGLAFALCLYCPKSDVEDSNISVGGVLSFMVFGHAAALVKSQKRSPLFHIVVIALSMSVCALVLYSCYKLPFYGSLGFSVGYVMLFGLECGQILQRKLSIGGNRNAILTNAVGFVAGCFVAE